MLRSQVQWISPKLFRRRVVLKRTTATFPIRCRTTSSWNFERISPPAKNDLPRGFCSKSFQEEPPENELVESSLDTGNEFEGGFWAGSEEDLTHLRINLYPKSTDKFITNLFGAESVQEVLDIIQSIPPEELNEKHSSQALTTLWDLQKLMFRIGPSFDPLKDFTNRKGFISQLKSNEVFSEKIFQHVLSNCGLLEDEPLASSLLCLKRLDYSMRSEPCQLLIEECVRRKELFPLPALSRLAVCMKSESIYGVLVILEFFPYLKTCLEDIRDDLTLRLASITLRNVHRLLSESIIISYRKSVRQILDSKIQLEVVTLCKVLLCLLDTRFTPSDSLDICYRTLSREVGKRLAVQNKDMTLLDVLSLYRFIEAGPQEPTELVLDTLYSKISTLIEENKDRPRLDLITCIVPFVRKLNQRKLLANYVNEYLDNYPSFEPISQVLLRILKILKLKDTELYDKYWTKATEHILSSEPGMERENEGSDGELKFRAVIKFGLDYLALNQGLAFGYKHPHFENVVKGILYTYLDNTLERRTPCFIYQSDVAKALSFLIAFSSPSDPVFTNNKYLPLIENNSRLKVSDLFLISRGVEASLFFNRDAKRNFPKYFHKIMDISSRLEESTCARLLEDSNGESELSVFDFVNISKLHLSIRRAFGDSPVFSEAVNKWTRSYDVESMESKLGREMATTLQHSNYNSPPVYNMMEDFICKNKYSVSPDMAEKFVSYAYSIGHELDSDSMNSDTSEVFDICHKILEKHMSKLQPIGILQSALALCFYRKLQTSLAHNIFSVEFIDEVDEELASSLGYGSYPLKVRHAFMELNRAVCLDMPDSNVPWFHKNFCDEVQSVYNVRDNYIHQEVSMVLGEVLNDPAFAKRGVFSPYSYLLDFLIEFDQKGRPIKSTPPKKRSIFSVSLTDDTPVEIGRKVAILVLPHKGFTKNVRQLKGIYKLRRRHLEILGYHVVEIDPQHWNSMYMTEPMAKNDFLENLIFSKKSEKSSKAEVIR